MLQGFRHHDQYALGATCQQLLVDNHPGFDGFTQSNFVRQQNARRMTLADFIGDMQLVRDQAGTHATQAGERQAILLALVFTRAETQGETVHTVDLAGKQAVLRFAEGQFAVQQHFAHRHTALLGIQAGADIGQQTVILFDLFDLQFPPFVVADGVARVEHHAGDWRVISGVEAVFTGCGEKQGNHARIQRHDGSQS
ncbi:hypothetical protein D3C72_1530360 [compost metagenome]